MESHRVDTFVLGTSNRANTSNTTPLRLLENNANAVRDETIVNLPDEDDHISLTATLERVQVKIFKAIPVIEV